MKSYNEEPHLWYFVGIRVDENSLVFVGDETLMLYVPKKVGGEPEEQYQVLLDKEMLLPKEQCSLFLKQRSTETSIFGLTDRLHLENVRWIISYDSI